MSSLPPGPELPPLVQTLAFHREPLGVLRRARARYGPLFTLRMSVAGPAVVAASAGAAAVLLEADADRAHAGEARRRMLPMASERSSFGGDGEAHRAARRRIVPAFAPDAIARRQAAFAAIDPSRWASGGADEAVYLPFGGGARRCIGLHLSQAYFATVVPAVLRAVRLRPVGRRPERMVVRATNLVPQRSGLMTAGHA